MKTFQKRSASFASQAKFAIHPVSIAIWFWMFFMLGILQACLYILAIVLHELGHFFMAKKLGYACQRFSLSPYGVELSYLKQNFERTDEIKIALAGPVANLISAFLVVGLWWIFPASYFYTESFVVASVVLALFNLLPAYPMDGGRVFICTAEHFFDRKLAKKITMCVNGVLCVLFFVLFVVFCFVNFNPTYLCIAFFMFAGVLDLKHNSKIEKFNVFCKRQINFAKPCVFIVYPDASLNSMLAKLSTSKTCVFCLVLQNGKILWLSEKTVINFSSNFGLESKLQDILKQ